MKLTVELNEDDLRVLVCAELRRITGSLDFDPDDVIIEVKSKQNYKSEWENASFRARMEKHGE